MLAFAPLASFAQIAPGTQLTGTIDQELSSASAQVGDVFTVSGVHSQNNDIEDARIYGHVVQVVRAGQGRAGAIELAYDKVYLASGSVYSLAGSGTISSQISAKSNTAKEVGGTVAGVIVGNILGKMVGTNLGGLLGGGAGYALAKNNRASAVIPKESKVVVEVNRPLRQTR
jgi:hypothetical protein